MLMPPKMTMRAGEMVWWVKLLVTMPGGLSPGSTWWKERADFLKLPVVLYPCSGRHTRKCTETINKIKLYIKERL